jgi:hypothetical protein
MFSQYGFVGDEKRRVAGRAWGDVGMGPAPRPETVVIND